MFLKAILVTEYCLRRKLQFSTLFLYMDSLFQKQNLLNNYTIQKLLSKK